MGTFSAKLRVWNPASPSRVEELDVIVDTGAAYSWVSRAKLESMGVRPVRRMQSRTIEGHTIERDLAPVFVATDGFSGGDNVVMAEPGDMEVMGSHTLESLGVTVDPVSKKLVPTVGLALTAVAVTRKRRVVTAIDNALTNGVMREPFSNEDFPVACPGFETGTYNVFLWKHRRENGKTTELFELVGPNRFRRIGS
jgi:aspartyl protease family protein